MDGIIVKRLLFRWVSDDVVEPEAVGEQEFSEIPPVRISRVYTIVDRFPVCPEVFDSGLVQSLSESVTLPDRKLPPTESVPRLVNLNDKAAAI